MPVAPKIKKQFEVTRVAVVQQRAFIAVAEASASAPVASAPSEAPLEEAPPEIAPTPPATEPEWVEVDISAPRAALLEKLEDLSIRLRRKQSVLPLNAVQALHAMKKQINAARDTQSLQDASDAVTAWEVRHLGSTPRQP